jgi:hypothetical protein
MFQLYIANQAQFNRGLERALAQINLQVLQACARGATQTAALVQDQSQVNVPVITGRLKASSVAVSAVIEGNRAKAAVGYTAPYAATVHENLEGRKPKFLERAVLAVGPRLRTLVVKELR